MKKLTDLKFGDGVWILNKYTEKYKHKRGCIVMLVDGSEEIEGEPHLSLIHMVVTEEEGDDRIKVKLSDEGKTWFINDPEGWKSKR